MIWLIENAFKERFLYVAQSNLILFTYTKGPRNAAPVVEPYLDNPAFRQGRRYENGSPRIMWRKSSI